MKYRLSMKIRAWVNISQEIFFRALIILNIKMNVQMIYCKLVYCKVKVEVWRVKQFCKALLSVLLVLFLMFKKIKQENIFIFCQHCKPTENILEKIFTSEYNERQYDEGFLRKTWQK